MNGRQTVKFLLILILVLVMSVTVRASLDSRVAKKLTGGVVATKQPIWKLYQYKETTLLQKPPFIWCPWKSYLVVNNNVTIECRNNYNCICINANLKQLVAEDAKYNQAYAKKFKATGTTKQKVRKIWKYCKNTTYKAHVKTAREVFTTRSGDCAGIAAAFYVLCKGKHIPVRYVIGWDGKICHAWNQVRIDKTWYWIDATYELWIQRKQYAFRKVMEVW